MKLGDILFFPLLSVCSSVRPSSAVHAFVSVLYFFNGTRDFENTGLVSFKTLILAFNVFIVILSHNVSTSNYTDFDSQMSLTLVTFFFVENL